MILDSNPAHVLNVIAKGEQYLLNIRIQFKPRKDQIKPKLSKMKSVLELIEHRFGLGQLKYSYAPSELYSRKNNRDQMLWLPAVKSS